MVVVPTLLTSAESVAALLEHIEVLALGNLDPRIHFAILSDFADADVAGPARRRGRFSPPRAPASRISIDGSAPTTRIASFCFIARGAGMRGNTRGWDGSANAARSRSSTGC